MTTRYQKKHYEDVARLLAFHWAKVAGDSPVPRGSRARAIMGVVLQDFADLFAADNPQQCVYCLTLGPKPAGEACPQRGIAPADANTYHSFMGFNRKQFLTACGLEEED